MVGAGKISSEMAKSLGIHKSLVSYYLRKSLQLGYIKEGPRGAFKILELTQAGKNFLAMYTNPDLHDTRVCRAENIRFKAEIISMPSIPVDWHKVEMNNWNQYRKEIDDIKVHINHGNNPTIEFIPQPVDGEDQDTIHDNLLQDCMLVAQEIEDTLGMKIGMLQLSANGEWVVYDPVAKAFSKKFGQIKIDGIGKVNASKPKRKGEFEFFDLRDCVDYMTMPRKMANMEQDIHNLQTEIHNIMSKFEEKGFKN